MKQAIVEYQKDIRNNQKMINHDNPYTNFKK